MLAYIAETESFMYNILKQIWNSIFLIKLERR